MKKIFLTLLFFVFLSPFSARAAGKIDVPVNYLGLNSGLVGWWTFDGKNLSTITAIDSSGNGNTATINNTPIPVRGKIGQALNFSSPSYLLTPSFGTPPNSITLSAWIKPNSAGGVVFSELGQASINTAWHDSQIEVETNGVVKVCVWTGSVSCVNATSSTTFNQWHFVVMTYNVSSLTLSGYYDGVLGNSTTLTKQYPSVLYYGIAATDGTNAGNGGYFSGSIDDARIYNRALSAKEVAALYDMGIGSRFDISQAGPTNLSSGLVGWWTFDGKNLSTATSTDSSGQGNNGTLNNAPTPVIGILGQALSFNGTNQYIIASTSAIILGDLSWTISAWINTTASNITSGGQSTYAERGATGNDIIKLDGMDASRQNSAFITMRDDAGNLLFCPGNSTTINNGKWHMETATRNGAVLTLYIDGVQDGSTCAWTFGNNFTGSVIPEIAADAANYPSTNALFTGKIDDVRTYNRALSAGEILQLYDLSKGKRH